MVDTATQLKPTKSEIIQPGPTETLSTDTAPRAVPTTAGIVCMLVCVCVGMCVCGESERLKHSLTTLSF